MPNNNDKFYKYGAIILALTGVVILLLMPRRATFQRGQMELDPPEVSVVEQIVLGALPEQAEEPLASPKTINTSLSYPYPLSWSDGSAVFAPEQYKFDLTGVSLGEMMAEQELVGDDGTKYSPGTEVYGLALHLKITNTSVTAMPTFPPMNSRLVKSEEGDMMIPATRQFFFGDTEFLPNSTVENRKAIFIVHEDKKEFLITTGGFSNIYFHVRVVDGELEVEKVPTGGG